MGSKQSTDSARGTVVEGAYFHATMGGPLTGPVCLGAQDQLLDFLLSKEHLGCNQNTDPITLSMDY